MAHFDIPLDLPHAGTITRRIMRIFEQMLDEKNDQHREMIETAEKLDSILFDASWKGENPPPGEAEKMREQASEVARRLVDQIESAHIGFDRLGQCVRNLFECLELGEEGAEISLRAGENPNSLQRP